MKFHDIDLRHKSFVTVMTSLNAGILFLFTLSVPSVLLTNSHVKSISFPCSTSDVAFNFQRRAWDVFENPSAISTLQERRRRESSLAISKILEDNNVVKTWEATKGKEEKK